MSRGRGGWGAVLGIALGMAVCLTGCAPLAGNPAAAADIRSDQPDQERSITVRLRAGVERLTVGPERRAGYDRDKFEHWVDADGDCRDTRDEVLKQESRRPVGSACDVSSGRWFSYYDRRTWTNDDDLDIDHFVPLAEAWDSGARSWTNGTRRRFANDLNDRRSLIAVTDNVNQSKGDQDVAEWLPEFNRCRYVTQWVAVKLRWSLRIERDERRALRNRADGCRNVRITVTKAPIERS